MPWNTRQLGLQVDLDRNYTHVDVAEFLISHRAGAGSPFTSHICDDSVRRLIDVAYYASLRPEEGRYPVFRLFSYPTARKQDELRTLARFAQPIECTADALRGLAAAFPPSSNLLVVDERDERLLISGVISPHMASTRTSSRPQLWTSGRPGGLEISVDAPAEFRLYESVVNVHYKAGRLRGIAPLLVASIGPDWIGAFGGSMVDRAATELGVPDANLRFGGAQAAAKLIRSIISFALGEMATASHGGALVIVPDAGLVEVDLKYHVNDMDIGATVQRYWSESVTVVDEEGRSEHVWNLERLRLEKQASLLARLANVDGCVVLSDSLNVQGFGCKLRPNHESAKKSAITFWDLRRDCAWENQEAMDLGGMRHMSAFHFVMTVPHSVAYVVSQDGDLTIFASDSEKAFCLRGVTPGLVEFA